MCQATGAGTLIGMRAIAGVLVGVALAVSAPSSAATSGESPCQQVVAHKAVEKQRVEGVKYRRTVTAYLCMPSRKLAGPLRYSPWRAN